MRFWCLVSVVALSACSGPGLRGSASDDPSSYLNTRISFTPIDREQRDRLLAMEKQVLETKTAEFKAEFDREKEKRDQRFDEIRREFPSCENQKHCLSELAHGDEKAFERYNALTKSLREFDLKLIDADGQSKDWRRRYDLRARAINNRYLVHEFLRLPKEIPGITRVGTHSLESFDSRKDLSRRLLQYVGDMPALTWGDLDFQMLKRPIDEAAVITTLDVWTAPQGGVAEHYLATFLVNSYQEDPLFYDKGFMRFWGDLLTEKDQKKLRESAFCSLYAVASDVLASKMASLKAKYCAQERTRMQALTADNFNDRFALRDWLLPISYYKFPNEK